MQMRSAVEYHPSELKGTWCLSLITHTPLAKHKQLHYINRIPQQVTNLIQSIRKLHFQKENSQYAHLLVENICQRTDWILPLKLMKLI